MILEEVGIKEKLLENINILKNQRREHDLESESTFLISGLLGNALTDIYCGFYLDEDAQLEKGVDLFKKGYEVFTSYKNDTNLAYGYAGLGWTLIDLLDLHLISNEDKMSPTFENLDKVIANSLDKDAKDKNFDLFAGLIGKGIYFLKRYEQEDYVLPYLEKIIDIIDEISVKDKIGSYWLTKSVINETEEIIISNGLSHGLPSIISFAAECLIKGINVEKSKKIINEATAWVLSKENPTCQGGNKFPLSLPLSEIESKKEPGNRLAWCYGDLGVALSLLKASVAMEDIELKLKSMLIIERLIKVDLEVAAYNVKEDCVDLGLCHGAVGVAMMFFRIHELVGEERVLERAHYWMDYTFSEISKHKDGVVFPNYDIELKEFQVGYCNNVIQGIDGLILCMLTFMEPQLSWDEVFMMNVASFKK